MVGDVSVSVYFRLKFLHIRVQTLKDLVSQVFKGWVNCFLLLSLSQ